MDNTHKKPTRIMDFAPAKRRPATATSAARSAAQPARPSASPQPQPARAQASVRPQSATRPRTATPAASATARPAAAFRRPTAAATDPLSARPLSRPASAGRTATASRPQTPARPAPRIIQSTTVKSVAATDDRVESFEFGIIEDLSPVVKPEPPMIPGSRPSASAQSRPARSAAATRPQPATRSAQAQARTQAQPSRPKTQDPPEERNYLDMSDQIAAMAAEEQQSKHHGSDKPSLFSRKGKSSDSAPRKSPFLSSVNVPKRPLSASAPTGIHAPTTPQAPASPASDRPHQQKRKGIPFIAIVILSVILGVALGAIVYFVLPH